MRGRLQMSEFERKIVPTEGLDDVILSSTMLTKFKEMVSFEKARRVLFRFVGKKKHE